MDVEARFSQTYIEWRDTFNNDYFVQTFSNPLKCYEAAARAYAYSDIYKDEVVEKIVVQGTEVVYNGWLPDMEFRFLNKSNREEILFDTFFQSGNIKGEKNEN